MLGLAHDVLFQDPTGLLSEEGSGSSRTTTAMRKYLCDQAMKRSSGEALHGNLEFEVKNWLPVVEKSNQTFRTLLNGLYGLDTTEQQLSASEVSSLVTECVHHVKDLVRPGDRKETQTQLPVLFSALAMIYSLFETILPSKQPTLSANSAPPTQFSSASITDVSNEDLLAWSSYCDDALCSSSLDWFCLEYQYTTQEPLAHEILRKRWETCILRLAKDEPNYPSLRTLINTTQNWARVGASKYSIDDYTHLIDCLMDLADHVPDFYTSPIASWTLRALCELWYIRSKGFKPNPAVQYQHRETLVIMALKCLNSRLPLITKCGTGPDATFGLQSDYSTYAYMWSLRVLGTVSYFVGNTTEQKHAHETFIHLCLPHWSVIVQCATPLSLLLPHRLLVCSAIKAISSLVQTGLDFESRKDILSTTNLAQTLVYLSYLDHIWFFLPFRSSSEQLLSILEAIPNQFLAPIAQPNGSESIPGPFLSILLPFVDNVQRQGLEQAAYHQILASIRSHAYRFTTLEKGIYAPQNRSPDPFWVKCAMRETSFDYEKPTPSLSRRFAVQLFQLCRIGILGETALSICDVIFKSDYDRSSLQDALGIAHGIVHSAIFPGETLQFPVALSQFLYSNEHQDSQKQQSEENWRPRVKSVLQSDFLDLMDSFKLSQNIDFGSDGSCGNEDMDPHYFLFWWVETARSLIHHNPLVAENGYIEFDWDGNTKKVRLINGWPGSNEDGHKQETSDSKQVPNCDGLLEAVKAHLKVPSDHVLLFHACSANELQEGGMTIGNVTQPLAHDFGSVRRYFHYRFSPAVYWALRQTYPDPVVLCFAIDVEQHKEAMKERDCSLFELPTDNPPSTLDPWTACIIASRLCHPLYFGKLGAKLAEKESLAGPIASSFPPAGPVSHKYKVYPCDSPSIPKDFDPKFNAETPVELPSNSLYECLTKVSIAKDVPPFQIAMQKEHLKKFVRSSDLVCIYFPRTPFPPQKRILHTVSIKDGAASSSSSTKH